jgi:coenzyme F420-0:L-glutamate ligase/coenzyme F420-1:gamma-L-glutamate ligase
VIAVADELASAAELVMRKTARLPVAIVRGAGEWLGAGTGAELVRAAEQDLFR